MRVRIDGKHGVHVLCDRCNQPAKALGDRPIWIEWDGDGAADDDPLIVCAACNASNPHRTKRLDDSLGPILLGLLINAHEPLGQAAEYLVAGHEFFGEGDLAAFVAGISEMAQTLEDAGLG